MATFINQWSLLQAFVAKLANKLLAKKAQRGNTGQMTLGRPRHVKRMKNELIDWKKMAQN
jgi:hypothetical protein